MLKFLHQKEMKITLKKKESRHLNNYQKVLKIFSRKKKVKSLLNWPKSISIMIRLKEIMKTENKKDKSENKENLNSKSVNSMIKHRTKTENLTEDKKEINTVKQEADKV